MAIPVARNRTFMMRWHAFIQLFVSRLREFYREPEVLFWVYGFPVLLAVGLGIAFWSREPEPPEVDLMLVSSLQGAVAELAERLKADGIRVQLHPEVACRQRYRTGKSSLCVVTMPDGVQYIYDSARAESLLARARVEVVVQNWKAGVKVEKTGENLDKLSDVRHFQSGGNKWQTADELTREPGNRYIDFLMPGLMGMNLMGGGLWGVGFVIVDLRVRKLLKRLLATPMRRGDFLLSILTSRMVVMVPEMTLLLLVGSWGFGMPLQGSLLVVIMLILLGSMAFSGIGLLVASRTNKTETVSGLMNLVMLPMWLLSGTFFSSKRFPDAMQPVIQALPLTQLNDALREVILEGASLGQVAWRMAILAGWAVVCFLLALKWFRWQ